MKTFYNVCIVVGLAAAVVMFMLVYTSPLPWWKWIIAVVSLLLIEFGCFAYRDKKNEEPCKPETEPAGSAGWYRRRAAEVRHNGKSISQYNHFLGIAQAIERTNR